MQRLTSGGLTDLLDQISPAIAAGAVNVISVAAIRDRSGDKWGRRREQVEAFLERAFTRLSPVGGVIVALNDLEFLAIQPDCSKWAALGVSSAVLKETLTFFLGEAAREDVRLLLVTGVRGGELAVEAVLADALERCAEPTAAPSPARETPPRGAEPICTRLDRSSRVSVVAAPGGSLQLACRAEPVWNVRDKVVTSFVLESRLTPAEGPHAGRLIDPAQLPTAAAYDVARLNLAYAAELIDDGEARGGPVALHVPFPWTTLSNGETRLMLLRQLRELSPTLRRRIVVEVTGSAAGVPPSRLAEVVALLAPHCRAVLARAASESDDLFGWRRCGLNGITIDCSHIGAADREALGRLSLFARRAAALAPACVGYGLNARSLILAAWAAGFSHVSGPAVSGEVGLLEAMRLAPGDLYRHYEPPDVERVRGAPAPGAGGQGLAGA